MPFRPEPNCSGSYNSYILKTPKVKKNGTNTVGELKGREFNSRPLSHFALSFVWAADGAEKIMF
jgi:hypothetical protein